MSGDNARAKLIKRYRTRIEQARVYDVARRTPLVPAPRLSQRLGNALWLKREDLQPVHSFKLRGAYNRMVHLTDEQRARGVVCASAGNHAQGVALAARTLGCTASIVMPRTTPPIKVEAVRALGGRVVLHGDSYDDASAHAAALVEKKGATYIPPYDDPLVIAGQGTIGREILEQFDEAGESAPDAVFVSVGGGGLLAGVAAWIKAVSPRTQVIGVEPEDSDCMGRALAAGRRVKLREVGLFADGVAVRQAGRETFRVARETVDAMLTVSVDEICAAVRDVFYEVRGMPEPAGALAVAGAKRWALERGVHGQRWCAVVSGANVNFDRLRHIAERAQLGDHSEALLAVTIPERPGAFRAFCRDLGRYGVTEFNYRYADDTQAHIFVGVRLDGGEAEGVQIIEALRGAGYPVVDLSNDEMAKLHIRYMVGGRSPGLRDERLFRIEFPERPGALLHFLNRLGGRWNVSLFHYRNHGSAHGRVLVGLQVPEGERRACRQRLDRIGYPWWEESENEAYRLFLGTE